MNFEYIVLTRKELRRLKALSRHPAGLPTKPEEAALMNNRLITRDRGGSHSPDAACPPYSVSLITQEGKNYLIYRKHLQSSNKRMILSEIISILALLISIISLCLDLG